MICYSIAQSVHLGFRSHYRRESNAEHRMLNDATAASHAPTQWGCLFARL